jgi:hypothetical protein
MPLCSTVIPISEVILSHFQVGHYTTHQPDGVHIEARCTCGEKLEGVGQNESAAMSAHFDIENIFLYINHER